MTKKALFVAAAFALGAAAACAQVKSYGPTPPKTEGRGITPVSAVICEENECKHEVTVDESQAPCKAVVNPEIMVVKKRHNVKILWNLTAPGYEFVSITFKDQVKAFLEDKAFLSRVKVSSKDQFYDVHVGKTEAFYRDKNTVDGAWLYNVVVKKGDKICQIDPPIINEY